MSAPSHLDEFCKPVSEFWRHDPYNCRQGGVNETCYDRLDLTLCFEDTAVLGGICVIFWLLAGVLFLCGSRAKPALQWSLLHLANLLLTLVVFAAALAELVFSIVHAHRLGAAVVAEYQYLSPSILAVTMVLVLLLTFRNKHRGVRSSGLLLTLWLALIFYGSFKLRSLFLLGEDRDGFGRELLRLIVFGFEYGAFWLLFVLSIFPYPHSRWGYRRISERKRCPEEDATFLSMITWWWLNGLIWKGWRKALVYDDLTDLNYEDKSSSVGPQFEGHWNKAVLSTGITFTGAGIQTADDAYHRVDTADDGDGVRVEGEGGRRRTKEPSLVWSLMLSFGGTMLVAAVFKFIQDVLAFASPQLLKLMINFTEDRSEPDWKGYFYALLLFLAAVLQSLFLHQYFHRCFLIGMRIRTAVIAAVYKKALLLSNRARQKSTVGEIVNLMSVDAQRFMDLMPYLNMIWSAPLQIVLSLVFLYFTMGPSIFAGFGVMLLLIPVNAMIAAKSRTYQVRQMIKKDARIKLVNEVLNGIKVIKLYAWEIPFQRLVMGFRQQELDVLKASAFLNAGASFSWTCAPFLVSLATFMTYALVNLHNPEEQLTAEKAFVALSLFNILRFPLSMLPFLVTGMVQASVSVKRLRTFLTNEELNLDNISWRPQPALGAEDSVTVTDGTFTWDSPERPVLTDINLRVRPGQLVAVVGVVGTGKSSLIQALLGELDKLSGSVSVKGSVALVPQQAWIQNDTLQNNILFGRPNEIVRYSETLTACALGPDLEILPGGDQTEIGEKGINLSGGQKQRVSLARAVYQQADIYLLDDPLSAVDSHVGKHIFDKVIGPEGVLRGKVRILVTHGVGFLSQCDQIVVLEEGGVSEIGSYTELIDSGGAFAEFMHTYANTGDNDEEGDPVMSFSPYEDEDDDPLPGDGTAAVTPGLHDDAESQARRQAHKQHIARQRSHESVSSERSTSRGQLQRKLSRQFSSEDRKAAAGKGGKESETTALIGEESVETGTVHFSVLWTYIKACTPVMSALTLIFYVFMTGCSVGSNFWLAVWSSANGNGNTSVNASHQHKTVCDKAGGPDVGCYLGIYAMLGLLQAFLVLFASFSLAMAAIFASRTLHDGMLKNILRSPMSFFDTTPLGRILNRFSKDIYTIDEAIPRSLRSFIWTGLGVISTLIVIVVATPIFSVVIVPLAVFYFLVQRFYVATSRQLKRLESTSRSPIYSHFQETVTGATSIRAYRAQERFMEQSENKVDYNQIAYYPSICANRWLAIRLEFVGNLIILFAALFAVIQRNYQDTIHLGISAGLVGLSISYALQVTQGLNWVVRMTSELETNIVAVERTKEYSETPTEAAAVIESHRPPDNWPTVGHVKFDHYSTRYRPGLDLVLRNITIDVPGGTKVGIVGRTGAGKSSLTVGLFRIIEAAGGAIFIDGVDIASFGLHDLRSKIIIIPQDPVLFSGTLRMNLDPFDSYRDEEVWWSLESAHLSSFVSALTEKLDYAVTEGGENLSVGQRQLVCLARALLRKTKILVLDEATAAVDMETDDLIQKTIRAEFGDCTILTIAHRLNTILDYDYVMVLDAGTIIEYDPPAELLGNRKSTFYSMAKDAGLVYT